jgi:hypothetical protein
MSLADVRRRGESDPAGRGRAARRRSRDRLVDNVLRPIVIGRDTRMPDYLILISTLGDRARAGPATALWRPAIVEVLAAIPLFNPTSSPTRPRLAPIW